MNLFPVNFVAGEVRTVSVSGRYFRILNGSGDFEVTARHYDGGAISSVMIAGLGVDLSNPDSGKPFKELTIKSNIDQEVRFLCSYFPSSDSRLTGDIDVNGLLSVVNAGGAARSLDVVTVTSGVATKVLSSDLSRLKSALYFSGDCYLGKDNTVSAATGYPISGGSDWLDESTAELWVYSVGAISVRVFSDLK